MNAVGIDVSKGKSMVCVMRPFGEVVLKPFEIHHTTQALSSLAKRLKDLDGETRVVLEATGRYHEPVVAALYNAGIYVSVVNPLLVHDYKNNSLRQAKTDKKDSVKIANYALANWNDLRRYMPEDEARQALKTCYRQYQQSARIHTMLRNNLISLTDQTFPGVNTLFTSPARADGSEKWVDFVETFWHCGCVSNVSKVAFTKRYQKWCHKHGYNFSEEKAAEIHSLAKESTVLFKNNTAKLLVKQSVVQLNAVSKAMAALRNEMDRLAQLLPEYRIVMEMYGVGTSLGPQLMAEIGDVRRFHSKKALVSFAGIDSPPNDSGKIKDNHKHISKIGSAQLRRTLFLIMSVILQNSPPDEPVYQFMDKKRAEGKPYKIYMMASANKFLRIYYARVQNCLAQLEISGTPVP